MSVTPGSTPKFLVTCDGVYKFTTQSIRPFQVQVARQLSLRERASIRIPAIVRTTMSDAENEDEDIFDGMSSVELLATVRDQRRQLQNERRQLQNERRRIAGTYYSTIDDVWTEHAEAYGNPELFSVLVRQDHPHYNSRPYGRDYYSLTAKFADDSDRDAASESSRSSLRNANREVWPTDIFGGDSAQAEIAHLIPHARDAATLYYDVAIGALGTKYLTKSWDALQRAVHGTLEESGDNKEANTGIKHMVANKIRLAGQATYLDKYPCVLIVPAMTVSEMKNWNGGGYKAIVLMGPWDGATLSDICAGIRMTEIVPEVASPGQIEAARCLLERVVLGLAYSLHHRSKGFVGNLSETQGRKFNRLVGGFQTIVGDKVFVPKPTLSASGASLRVRRVSFASAADEGGHPAPDPWLLAARAAVTWSRRHFQQLLAEGEPEELDGMDEADKVLDVLGVENFLEWRGRTNRDRTLKGLTVGRQGS